MIELSVIRDFVAIFGVIAGFSYYVLVVRSTQKNQQQQLETRQAQMFYGIYNRISQADFVEAWNAFQRWEYTNYDESMKILSNEQNRRYWTTLGFYFSGLGVLVRLGLVPIHYIANFLPHVTRAYWEKQAPIIKEYREKENNPRRHIEIEYLYNDLMNYLEEHPELMQ